jgi:putative hydrolase of HD superfamily
LNLWLEYEDGTSVEADLARQLDKFEMIVQANEYEMAQSKVLQSFFDSTQDVFIHPEVTFSLNTIQMLLNIYLTILN